MGLRSKLTTHGAQSMGGIGGLEELAHSEPYGCDVGPRKPSDPQVATGPVRGFEG